MCLLNPRCALRHDGLSLFLASRMIVSCFAAGKMDWFWQRLTLKPDGRSYILPTNTQSSPSHERCRRGTSHLFGMRHVHLNIDYIELGAVGNYHPSSRFSSQHVSSGYRRLYEMRARIVHLVPLPQETVSRHHFLATKCLPLQSMSGAGRSLTTPRYATADSVGAPHLRHPAQRRWRAHQATSASLLSTRTLVRWPRQNTSS